MRKCDRKKWFTTKVKKGEDKVKEGQVEEEEEKKKKEKKKEMKQKKDKDTKLGQSY